MNTDQLLDILNDYLDLLQSIGADDDKITEVKEMIWSIDSDEKTRRFLNNLSLSGYSRYRR